MEYTVLESAWTVSGVMLICLECAENSLVKGTVLVSATDTNRKWRIKSNPSPLKKHDGLCALLLEPVGHEQKLVTGEKLKPLP
jgi:hypothetical protein